MEFQLKYDSFRICFCSRESYVTFRGIGVAGVDGERGPRTEDIFSSLYPLSTHLPACPPPPSPILHQKGNDLAETLLFRGTLWLEPAARQKMGCYDKGLLRRKVKNGGFS